MLDSSQNRSVWCQNPTTPRTGPLETGHASQTDFRFEFRDAAFFGSSNLWTRDGCEAWTWWRDWCVLGGFRRVHRVLHAFFYAGAPVPRLCPGVLTAKSALPEGTLEGPFFVMDV